MAHVHSVCGASPNEILCKRAHAEMLQYDAIWWQDFDRQRQMHAFDRVARIYVLSVFAKDDGEVLV